MDSAFQTAAYPSYTTDDLRHMLRTRPSCLPIWDEIHRRERVAAGDMTVATPGERLAYVTAQRKATDTPAYRFTQKRDADGCLYLERD